ncbi:MAG: hypothetical protein ACO34J_10135 [Prochlorothrix sp.]
MGVCFAGRGLGDRRSAGITLDWESLGLKRLGWESLGWESLGLKRLGLKPWGLGRLERLGWQHLGLGAIGSATQAKEEGQTPDPGSGLPQRSQGWGQRSRLAMRRAIGLSIGVGHRIPIHPVNPIHKKGLVGRSPRSLLLPETLKTVSIA